MSLREKIIQETLANKLSHAYLLIGNPIQEVDDAVAALISETGCRLDDIVEIEEVVSATSDKKSITAKSDEIKVDSIREFIRKVNLTPYGPYRIGLIRRAERLNKSSANILLKTLEEPPKNVIIVLTASNESVIPTIRSRCRVYKSARVAEAQEADPEIDQLVNGSLGLSFKKIEEVVKKGETSEFVSQLIRHFEQRMLAKRDARTAEFLERVFEAEKRIRGNANARLVLENLIIEAKTF